MIETMCFPTMNTTTSPKITPISHADDCIPTTKNPILHHQRTSFVLPIRKRAFKTVRFAPFVNKESDVDSKDVFASPHKELTEEMIRTTWYSKQDIATFQKRSKLTILLKARFPAFAQEHNINESALGLERFSPKRAAYKRAALKFTLQAQQKTNDPNFFVWPKNFCTH